MYRELQILLRLKHQNIVQLLGVIPRPLGVVVEYMDGGNVFDYLRACREINHESDIDRSVAASHSSDFLFPSPLPCWKERIKLASEIASGMAFLHSKLFIHRDLKTPNILLKREAGCEFHTAKVSDFGTCASVDFADVFHGSEVDNPRWLAPEVLNDSPYSVKVDVYAFGKAAVVVLVVVAVVVTVCVVFWCVCFV
jgi:serine/threonine protein kinase